MLTDYDDDEVDNDEWILYLRHDHHQLKMQFNKVLLVLAFVFIGCCWESALTARLHQQGRSASLRIFPLRQRKLSAHGRSATSGSLFEVPAPAQAEEGRGLMKKFMLFKSLFLQEKSEPNNNIIIITQPATTATATNTPTTPTTAGTTGTTATTTAAATPTGTNTGRDSKTEDETDDDLPIKTPQLEGAIKELDNSQAEEIFNKRNNLQNQKPQKRRIRLSKRNQQRRRLTPQQQQQKQNTINRENLLTNMNLTKRPNQHAKNNSNKNHMQENNNDNNTNNSNNNNDNNTSGILNLNTNIRLQNIMNAFRKQTPIMYNY
ncbi:J domain-containing protein DDB_G0295729 [Lucilia sericata]|uniref:J domain-containing protein DDB_G0295729 n=1 Tax=Lucilia sericata TaxID=13632 RepID=UPI0018A83C76|nr:J domain-containing protein DDB_G0295729 [Lucilia sericata]